MKEFVTAVVANEDESKEGWVEFKVDGVKCKAKRPQPGQIAYLTASLHKRATEETQIAGVVNFCMSIMDGPTASYLSDKLLDQDDQFELPELQDIVEYLVEEWTGRPTEPSSGSTPTAPPTGSTSTPDTPAEATYSNYESTDSSTTSTTGV